jgi:hypothetical protein
VLGAFSQHLKEQITNTTNKTTPRSKAGKLDTITVKNIDSQLFKILLDFAYSGEIEISQDNIRQIAKAGELLNINSIKRVCCDFMGKDITIDNCLESISFYKELGFIDSAAEAIHFASRNFEVIIDQPHFCHLDGQSFFMIMESYYLYVQREEILFDAVKLWFRTNPERGSESKEYLEKIFKRIRFPLMSAEYLCSEVQILNEDLNSPVLQELLEEAKLCHLLPEKKKELEEKDSTRIEPRSNYGELTSSASNMSCGHSSVVIQRDIHDGICQLPGALFCDTARHASRHIYGRAPGQLAYMPGGTG